MDLTTPLPVALGEHDPPSGDLSAGPVRPGAAAATALWVFMGVVTMLFSLSSLAYVLRLDGVDGYPLALPWQLWLSTALLAVGGLALQGASLAARRGHRSGAHALWLAGGVFTLAFLGAQLWAWSGMQAARVTLTGNPAGSFFYMLTALHGLHVAGGIVAWLLVTRIFGSAADPAGIAWRITLCARYWHLLLLVWASLFAMMALLTPEMVRAICSTLKA